MTWGGGIFAPALTVWFRALERVPVKGKWPAALVRTGLDQFAFAPLVITGKLQPSACLYRLYPELGLTQDEQLMPVIGFFTVMTLLEGKDMNAVKKKWDEVREGILIGTRC